MKPPSWKRAGPDGEIEIKFPTGRRFKIEKQYDENIRHKGEWKVMEWDTRTRDWEWADTYSPKAYAKEMTMKLGQYDKRGKKVADYSATFKFESVNEESNPRIPRKKGQPANSDKHSDLYTDENPKGTIHGLKFATVKDAKASVKKIENSGKKHAHKIQAAVAMEQRAKVMGKVGPAAVYRKYIEAMKKKTKKMSEDVPSTSTANVVGAGDDSSTVVVDRRRRKDKPPVILKRFRGFMKDPLAPKPEESYKKK